MLQVANLVTFNTLPRVFLMMVEGRSGGKSLL
uniref:Uncharacterized protein n=1 Tax=Arundo donax TaxID=35708 RepID=A0A0A9BSG1_ARUDO